MFQGVGPPETYSRNIKGVRINHQSLPLFRGMGLLALFMQQTQLRRTLLLTSESQLSQTCDKLKPAGEQALNMLTTSRVGAMYVTSGSAWNGKGIGAN